MTVLYHPEFPRDIRRFAVKYADISPRLETRFRHEVDLAIAEVMANPTGAGHFINTGVPHVVYLYARRCRAGYRHSVEGRSPR